MSIMVTYLHVHNLCYIGSKPQFSCCFRNAAEKNHIKKLYSKGDTLGKCHTASISSKIHKILFPKTFNTCTLVAITFYNIWCFLYGSGDWGGGP